MEVSHHEGEQLHKGGRAGGRARLVAADSGSSSGGSRAVASGRSGNRRQPWRHSRACARSPPPPAACGSSRCRALVGGGERVAGGVCNLLEAGCRTGGRMGATAAAGGGLLNPSSILHPTAAGRQCTGSPHSPMDRSERMWRSMPVAQRRGGNTGGGGLSGWPGSAPRSWFAAGIRSVAATTAACKRALAAVAAVPTCHHAGHAGHGLQVQEASQPLALVHLG